MKTKQLIVLLSFLFIILSLCGIVCFIKSEPAQKEIFISQELYQIEIDSVFNFASIVEEEFDSLYLIYPYLHSTEFSKSLEIDEFDRDLLLWSVKDDVKQAILFTKNRKPVFYAYVRGDSLRFKYFKVEDKIQFSKGYSYNANFLIRKNEKGEKELNFIE